MILNFWLRLKITFWWHPSKIGVNDLLDHFLAPHVTNVRLRNATLHHVLPQHLVVGIGIQVEGVSRAIPRHIAGNVLEVDWSANLVLGALAADQDAGGEAGTRQGHRGRSAQIPVQAVRGGGALHAV